MAKDFIAGAIHRPDALREKLHVPAGKDIPATKLAAAEKKPGLEGEEARFAKTLKTIHPGLPKRRS